MHRLSFAALLVLALSASTIKAAPKSTISSGCVRYLDDGHSSTIHTSKQQCNNNDNNAVMVQPFNNHNSFRQPGCANSPDNCSRAPVAKRQLVVPGQPNVPQQQLQPQQQVQPQSGQQQPDSNQDEQIYKLSPPPPPPAAEEQQNSNAPTEEAPKPNPEQAAQRQSGNASVPGQLQKLEANPKENSSAAAPEDAKQNAPTVAKEEQGEHRQDVSEAPASSNGDHHQGNFVPQPVAIDRANGNNVAAIAPPPPAEKPPSQTTTATTTSSTETPIPTTTTPAATITTTTTTTTATSKPTPAVAAAAATTSGNRKKVKLTPLMEPVPIVPAPSSTTTTTKKPKASATPIVYKAGLTVALESKDDFCLFLPSSPGNKDANGGEYDKDAIGDSEKNARAFCTSDGLAPGAQKMPDGFIRSANFKSTDKYVQVTGTIDNAAYHLSDEDGGGQYDDHGSGSPPESHCKNYPYYVSLIEPNLNRFCIRCCESYKDCNAGRSEYGCDSVLRE